MHEQQLYITGRIDDLIIIRGLNHHPQDIEATARQCHPLLVSGLGAAFAVEERGAQRLVLVHEVVRDGSVDLAPVIDAIRAAVLEVHGLALDAVVLIRCGTIDKTSSGKVQRHAIRAAFRTDETESRSPGTAHGPGSNPRHLARCACLRRTRPPSRPYASTRSRCRAPDSPTSRPKRRSRHSASIPCSASSSLPHLTRASDATSRTPSTARRRPSAISRQRCRSTSSITRIPTCRRATSPRRTTTWRCSPSTWSSNATSTCCWQ